jgi:hypothetical protein
VSAAPSALPIFYSAKPELKTGDTASLILSLCSVFTCVIPIANLVLPVIGLILGIKALKLKPTTKAWLGVAFSAFFLTANMFVDIFMIIGMIKGTLSFDSKQASSIG